jgi:hypothetical protein
MAACKIRARVAAALRRGRFRERSARRGDVFARVPPRKSSAFDARDFDANGCQEADSKAFDRADVLIAKSLNDASKDRTAP